MNFIKFTLLFAFKILIFTQVQQNSEAFLTKIINKFKGQRAHSAPAAIAGGTGLLPSNSQAPTIPADPNDPRYLADEYSVEKKISPVLLGKPVMEQEKKKHNGRYIGFSSLLKSMVFKQNTCEKNPTPKCYEMLRNGSQKMESISMQAINRDPNAKRVLMRTRSWRRRKRAAGTPETCENLHRQMKGHVKGLSILRRVIQTIKSKVKGGSSVDPQKVTLLAKFEGNDCFNRWLPSISLPRSHLKRRRRKRDATVQEPPKNYHFTSAQHAGSSELKNKAQTKSKSVEDNAGGDMEVGLETSNDNQYKNHFNKETGNHEIEATNKNTHKYNFSGDPIAPGYGVPGFNSRYDNRFSYAGMEGMGKGGGGFGNMNKIKANANINQKFRYNDGYHAVGYDHQHQFRARHDMPMAQYRPPAIPNAKRMRRPKFRSYKKSMASGYHGGYNGAYYGGNGVRGNYHSDFHHQYGGNQMGNQMNSAHFDDVEEDVDDDDSEDDDSEEDDNYYSHNERHSFVAHGGGGGNFYHNRMRYEHDMKMRGFPPPPFAYGSFHGGGMMRSRRPMVVERKKGNFATKMVAYIIVGFFILLILL